MSASERAFRLAGRFSVTTATDPSVSKPRCLVRHLTPSGLALTLVPAILREVLFVSDPLGELDAHLAERMEVGVELEGDHALVLAVVVPEDDSARSASVSASMARLSSKLSAIQTRSSGTE